MKYMYAIHFCHAIMLFSLEHSSIVRYLYLIPLKDDATATKQSSCWDSTDKSLSAIKHVGGDIDVQLVSTNLGILVGKRLDYTAFARDTPPGTLISH